MGGSRHTQWVEVEITVSDRDAAEVAGFVATTVLGAQAGVELRETGVVFWVPLCDGASALQETQAAVSALAAGGIQVDPAGVRLQPAAPEAEWRDAWMRHFGVTRVTQRIVIVPSWEAYAPAPTDVVLEVDPGQAFGTGSHASTRLCLTELDELSSADPSVVPSQGWTVVRFLDLGAGSGILAIAAAKLWPASSGLAIDVDPVAVEVAAENVRRNGVTSRVTCALTPLEAIHERFDLVTANIQADILRTLRDAVVPRIAPSGVLILSGLLAEDAEDVAREYAAFPKLRILGVRRSAEDPEWSAAVLQRLSD